MTSRRLVADFGQRGVKSPRFAAKPNWTNLLKNNQKDT